MGTSRVIEQMTYSHRMQQLISFHNKWKPYEEQPNSESALKTEASQLMKNYTLLRAVLDGDSTCRSGTECHASAT